MHRADTKITLPESDIPTHFYNIAPDLPTPLPPPLHPATRQPIGPEALAPIFPMGLIAQEVSQERLIEIPDEVRDIYRLYRPSPMFRARAFEEALDTPAHIYYKSEHVSPVGSHKLNTAIMQAYVNKQEGVKRLATETGAGQWGSALVVRVQADRPRVHGLHGPDQLRPEAVPADHDEDVRRRRRGQPVAARRRPAATSSRATRTRRAASASPSPKRWRTRRSATTRSTRSAAC